MNNKEIVEKWENTFGIAFAGDADNYEHIEILVNALEKEEEDKLLWEEE